MSKSIKRLRELYNMRDENFIKGTVIRNIFIKIYNDMKDKKDKLSFISFYLKVFSIKCNDKRWKDLIVEHLMDMKDESISTMEGTLDLWYDKEFLIDDIKDPLSLRILYGRMTMKDDDYRDFENLCKHDIKAALMKLRENQSDIKIISFD